MSLATLFTVFLRLGAVGFGGPIALVSLIEQECCHRRRWLGVEAFNERYVFCKLLPGPVASQMAMWVGYDVRGRRGALVAGVAFIVPAFSLILALSYFYRSLMGIAQVVPAVRGMEAAALVVILDSVGRMFRPYVARPQPWIFAALAALLMLRIPRWEPVLILLGGLVTVIFSGRRGEASPRLVCLAPAWSLWFQIFWVHFKAGATVFGTGLAVVPVLQHEIVERFHWMSNAEFVDGIAFGQITPGPVTITSVFVGYRTAGLAGALAGGLGMYLPGVILILFVVPALYEKLRRRAFLADFHRGAVPTVIGCIFGASLLLGRELVTSRSMAALVAALGLVAIVKRPPGWALILVGSALGFFLPL